MFTPWNACPLVPCNGRRAKHIPLGPAPWNLGFVCLLAKNDRIGGDRLDLLHRGGVIPLGLSSEFRIPSSEFGNAPYALCYALCPLRHALYVMHHACRSTGAQSFFKQVLYKKLHQLTMRVELFLFSYPVGLKAYFTGAETISPEAAYGERSKRV